ncbi:MAG TPA: PTS sugar transporter [Ruminococcaceae bacterium]|jgi:phosphotransferase system HPr-like phosphotransfer protein|nr:PTS sugar transporter [Oscillospiraceae bacterium]HBQ45912.1 PTS sugar transporter [Oscillospiraceae bacterium]HBT91645.1 PTS sugar transporter [Oscillospiraceae bacterium]HCB91512.1 PTS sugar transporter [Oscillospiraceae bacterium]
MLTVPILLDSAEKVKRFSAAVSKVAVECELVQGVRIIDAKSIMGIFSLNLKQPIQLRVHSDDRSALKPIRDFLTEAR